MPKWETSGASQSQKTKMGHFHSIKSCKYEKKILTPGRVANPHHPV